MELIDKDALVEYLERMGNEKYIQAMMNIF